METIVYRNGKMEKPDKSKMVKISELTNNQENKPISSVTHQVERNQFFTALSTEQLVKASGQCKKLFVIILNFKNL
ncbi:hypothetical protein M513_08265 [Trichuris suis]|uniref:Uncharacterized protein n=1 Tax=Trichuris suis TaxID=68888 RepID=A0A085M0T1_9BILA|nr:hypothetical protein M513_08265 [Trichuris suis]